MIIRQEELQKICSKILSALDTDNSSLVTDTLAINAKNKTLYLSVTNREYYVKTKLNLLNDVEFEATVAANHFLKLISKITTETIKFTIEDNSLVIEGNGTYKLPMIYDNEDLLKLPEITIDNVTTEFEIDNSILSNIVNYNSKELAKRNGITNPVQSMYYLDEEGCITFTSGACVNKFTLPESLKLLLNDKVVKLFKLFEADKVKFKFGQDTTANGDTQNKVYFSTDMVELTAIITSDNTMINSVPTTVIRDMAFSDYDYSVVLAKTDMLNILDRLLIFTDNQLTPYGKFEFDSDKLTLSVLTKNISETLFYKNKVDTLNEYETAFDLSDFKLTLSGIKSDFITFKFGNGKAGVIIDNNVYNIIPECVV